MSIKFSEHDETLVEFITLVADEAGNFVAPNSKQLFSGDFERSGSDLIISGDGAASLHLPGYFATETPADIFDTNGAVLRGDLVELLAGPIAPAQYAQVGAQPGASPIGQVETLEGGASVQRADGVVETLQIGMKIFQQDLIQTSEDGTVSVTFVDGTIFTLSSESRMVIDELVFDPDANDNSAGFSLIQGGFVFIAGQVAKTGGMDVGTPASTMGIRGTTVLVQIGTDAGVVTTEVTLTNDPDGDVGTVALFDLDGNLIANITETDTKWVVSAADDSTRELARTPEDDLEDSVLIAEAFAAFRAATSRVEAGDTFVSLSDSTTTQQNLQQNQGVDTDLDVNGVDDQDALDPLDEIENEVESDDIGPLDESNLLEDEVQVPTLIAVQGFEDATEDSAIAGQAVVQNPDEIPIVFGLGQAPANGTATVNADGTFSFVPEPDFNGIDSFTFTANGPEGELAQGTVVVEVLPVNDAPVAQGADLSMVEDGIVSGTIEAVDIDGDELSYNLQDLPTDGEVLVLQNGTYTYTPDPDFEGTDSFSVLVSDVEGAASLATISVTVLGENDPPVIVTSVTDATGALTEDAGPTSIGGTLEAEDPDPGALPEWSGSASGAFGSFDISESGVWSYTLDPTSADTLDAGETVEEVFTATVTDADGVSDSIDVTVTLTGTNDQPVLTTTAANLEGALTEDSGPIAATGTLSATDVDGDAELSWSTSAVPSMGTFTVTPEGQWTYTLDAEAAQQLAIGETFDELLSVSVSDGIGAPLFQAVTVRITGTNDVPVLTTAAGANSGIVVEGGGSASASGQLSASDVDNGAVVTWGGVSSAIYGTFDVSENGAWTYTLDPDLADALAEGDVVQETFDATAQDQFGASVSQIITVTINGDNDGPVITTEVGEDAGTLIEDSGPLSAAGTLSATDADSAVSWSGSEDGNFGAFVIQTTGEWTYTVDPDAIQFLAEGQEVTDSFVAAVTDGLSSPVEQVVTVTITGTDDLPVITSDAADATGGLTEDVGPIAASGVLSATDVDGDASWSGSTDGVYGAFSIDPDGAWTYTLDPETVQFLALGQEVTEIFTASVTDGAGAPVTQDVSVTITGTDDLPVVTSSAADATGSLIEDGGAVVASGALTATDVDGAASWSGSATGDYGTFAIDPNGAWTYTLVPSSVQFLAQDQQVVETFDVVVSDGVGEGVIQTVSVTITGTDDLPVITSTTADAEGDLTEDIGPLVASGTLAAADVDGTATWSGSATGIYGAFVIQTTGAWTYTVDPATVQFLAQGQQLTETFDASVTDGVGAPVVQTVTVTITGTNDAPVITSDASQAQAVLIEGEETIVASGVLAATDADAGQTPVWSGTSDVLYGEFELSETGSWTYELDNAAADVLAVGDTRVESLTAVASDGLGGTTEIVVEVTIIGTNDRPIVTTNTVFETIEAQMISGALSASDVDGAEEDLIFSVSGTGAENGTLVINPDGTFDYTPDAGFLGIERIEYQVEDADGGVSTGRITIEVESDPDDPDNENVSIGLNTKANDDTAAGAVEIGIDTTPVTSVNLAIALDRSTSIGFLQWQELLASVRDALSELALQFEGSDTTVDVKIITFASDVDVTQKPDGTDYQLSDPELLDIINNANLPYRGGATSWELAFVEAGNFFFSQDPAESNVLFFVTDGVPTSGTFTEPLNELRDTTDAFDVTINAFGFGAAYEEDDLLLVDTNATFLSDSSQLTAAFQTTPIFNPELISLRVELEADDGAAVQIADETSDALVVEGTDFELPLASIDNILDLLGESNRINITAQFDVNNDPSDAEIELFSSDVIGKADSVQTASGRAGDDLMFGSDLADVISGNGGNDVLIGFGGADTIDGGSGSDSIRAGDGDDRIVISDGDTSGDDIDGGGGRDTLAVDAIADITAILSSLDLSGVEAVDVTNAQSDSLTLGFEDVFALSDTGDDVLNAYLGETQSNSLSLYGDGTDTLTLDGGDTYDISLTGQVNDGAGNTLNIYEFSDGGGNALATLGVETDISVVTANVPVA